MRNYLIFTSAGRLVGVKSLTTAQVRLLRSRAWRVDALQRTADRNVNTGA